MEDIFDSIPVAYRSERLDRIRDLIVQTKADFACYEALKQKIESGTGSKSDIEEMIKTASWLKRDILVYKKLNSMSIEGITCGEDGLNRRPFLPRNMVAFYK